MSDFVRRTVHIWALTFVLIICGIVQMAQHQLGFGLFVLGVAAAFGGLATTQKTNHLRKRM